MQLLRDHDGDEGPQTVFQLQVSPFVALAIIALSHRTHLPPDRRAAFYCVSLSTHASFGRQCLPPTRSPGNVKRPIGRRLIKHFVPSPKHSLIKPLGKIQTKRRKRGKSIVGSTLGLL